MIYHDPELLQRGFKNYLHMHNIYPEDLQYWLTNLNLDINNLVCVNHNVRKTDYKSLKLNRFSSFLLILYSSLKIVNMLIQLTSAFNHMERCKFAKRRVLFKLVQIRNHLELVLIRDQLKISNGLQVSLKNGKNYKDVHKNMETELICDHRLRFKSRISRLINEKKNNRG